MQKRKDEASAPASKKQKSEEHDQFDGEAEKLKEEAQATKALLHQDQVLPSQLNPPQHHSLISNYSEFEIMYKQSIDHPEQFWDRMAKRYLHWITPYETVKSGNFADGDICWFLNGQLNVTLNCIDRHLEKRGDQVAIIYEGDVRTDVKKITYKELHHQVCKLANFLKELGVRKGDSVAIYMPMIPEAAYSMLACARIGAVHTVVFGGFSAESLRHRINDARSKVVITANEGVRGGRTIPLKQTVDEALLGADSVQHVVVFRRTATTVPLKAGRDLDMIEGMKRQRPYCPAEPMNSEDPLFILYTSGSTGKPKGMVHTTGGYLLYATVTHRYIFDYRDGDVYACMADVGWITGHTYVVYGPLSNGATTVMFESLPTYPDAGRCWDMVERHKINIFYTAPTAIRALMKFGTEPVKKYDRSSLRVLASVGEPINPEAWRWYFQEVGEGRCSIVDTYWQTETGGIIVSALAGLSPMKPGSASFPFFGIRLAIIDPQSGQPIEGKGTEGVLGVASTWPSITRTILGDHSRFLDTYMNHYPGYYFTGDGCQVDSEGFLFITGRVDDVINKAGHRLGTAEIESALVSNQACAEAAVVAIPDDLKGQAVVAYCILKAGYRDGPEAVDALKLEVRKRIGPIATPDLVILTPALPKTRSGKIMRRILRKIAENQTSPDQLGDITTLADPDVVSDLIQRVKATRK